MTSKMVGSGPETGAIRKQFDPCCDYIDVKSEKKNPRLKKKYEHHAACLLTSSGWHWFNKNRRLTYICNLSTQTVKG